MNELRQASQRPQAAFVLRGMDPVSMEIPNFVACRTLVQLFAINASAELALGHAESAFQDLFVISRMVEALHSSSTLVATMIRVAIVGLATDVFWEGLATGRWSDAQLEQFQKRFGSYDLVADVERSLRQGERAHGNWIIGKLATTSLIERIRLSELKGWSWMGWGIALIPQGWHYQNRVVFNRVWDEAGFLPYDARQRRFLPHRPPAKSVEQLIREAGSFGWFASIAIPNCVKAGVVAGHNQVAADQIVIACALERYRRAQGQYPATLDALVPRCLDKLPHDLMNGEALKYRVSPRNEVTLYSVGWDQKDDGGVALGTYDAKGGDWVFSWPIRK